MRDRTEQTSAAARIVAVPARAPRTDGQGSRRGAALLIAAGATLSLAILLRVQLQTGFTLITGGIYDGRIEISLLQHWYNVLRGLEPWNRPSYFYPLPDTLGYNDGYLLFGLIFSLVRAIGVEPIMASEIVNICVRMIGYGAFIALAVDALALPLVWAVLGAVLFTISNGMFIQEMHQQLLAVGFAPLQVWLVWKAWTTLTPRPRHAALYGSAAAALFGAWLLTGFYMAWFTVFYSLLAGLVLLLQPAIWPCWRRVPARLLTWPSAVIAVVLAAAIAPFVAVYAPTAAETGQHAFAETVTLLPNPADLVHVGADNLLFGWADQALTLWTDPGESFLGEHVVGFSPLLLILSGFGFWLAWRPEAQLGARLGGRAIAWRTIGGAILLTLLACLRVDGRSFWHAVYLLVPGATAIRAETRLLLFLDLPIVLLAMMAMERQARRWSAPVVAALAMLLIVGEINLGSAQQIDRAEESAVIDRVPPAPADCSAFYVATRGRQKPAGPPAIDALYHHTVDAMVLSEMRALPTIDGYASFVPHDVTFVNRLPVWPMALRQYARVLGIGPTLCGLDLTANRWIDRLAEPSLLPADGTIRFDTPSLDPVRFLGLGWSYQEATARWTDGRSASIEVALPASLVGRRLLLAVDATPFAPAKMMPSPVSVQVDGRTVARWLPRSGQQRFEAAIAGSGPDLELTLLIERPLSPSAAGLGADGRLLGLYVRSISITPTP